MFHVIFYFRRWIYSTPNPISGDRAEGFHQMAKSLFLLISLPSIFILRLCPVDVFSLRWGRDSPL